MSRYVERAFGWHDDSFDDVQFPGTVEINVDGPKLVDTGLVTARETKIMRVQAPIGFGRDGEH